MSLQRVTELPTLSQRPLDSHKGTFGRVLLIGGRPGMAGAMALAGLGALRGGAGLVYLAAPSNVVSIVSSIEPSYLTIPLPVDPTGELSAESIERLQTELHGKSSCGIGPGFGTSTVAQNIVTQLYRDEQIPLVVDADGLNCLAISATNLSVHSGPRILTPHPGEFARLIGSDIATVQGNREELAVQFAQEHDVILVLKGHRTVVTNGNQIYINTTGNSGMSTGGTGDVLTGLTTALLAQKMPPFEAAQLAVYLHGLSGDIAAKKMSQPGLIASDLPRFLGKAWKQYLKSVSAN